MVSTGYRRKLGESLSIIIGYAAFGVTLQMMHCKRIDEWNKLSFARLDHTEFDTSIEWTEKLVIESSIIW